MDADQAAVLDTQARRFRAMTEGNQVALANLLADDLVYTHTTAAVDTKESFLATLAAGALRYEVIEPEETRCRTYGAVGVITGTSRMRVGTRDESRSFRIRFTDVYARTGDEWKLVAWQSTRLPETD